MKNNPINDFMQRVMQSHHLAGMAVGVVMDGEPCFADGYGVRKIETRNEVTPVSVFHLASISKLFTATAVMLLAEQGKLDLDESPAKYLPYLQMGRDVTIRQMLAHISGFSDVIDYEWDAPEDDDEALERYVRGLEGEMLFSPGECFAYSNIAYEVLGDVIAKVSRMSFEAFIETNLLFPIDMYASTHFANRVPEAWFVSPHVNDLGTRLSTIYPYHRAHAPSSTLHSNIADMNRWAIEILNEDSQLIKRDMLLQMWKPQMPVGQRERPNKRIGLGWFMDIRRDLKYFYHSGSDVGFSTYFLLVPEKSIGVTVLCNTAPAPVEEIAWGVLDATLGIEPDVPKPPVMTALGPVYRDSGLEAMQDQFEVLKAEHSEEYDFGSGGFVAMASSLLDQNQNYQTIDLLTFALTLAPDSAKVYETLARAYFQSGDFERAIVSAQRALELEPDNPFLRQQIQSLI